MDPTLDSLDLEEVVRHDGDVRLDLGLFYDFL